MKLVRCFWVSVLARKPGQGCETGRHIKRIRLELFLDEKRPTMIILCAGRVATQSRRFAKLREQARRVEGKWFRLRPNVERLCEVSVCSHQLPSGSFGQAKIRQRPSQLH